MTDAVTLAGAGLTLLSTVGYAVAMVAPYPGRSLTLPGLMVGLTLLAVGLAADHDLTATASEAAAAAETTSEAVRTAETTSEAVRTAETTSEAVRTAETTSEAVRTAETDSASAAEELEEAP